jgi:hypothetical protein
MMAALSSFLMAEAAVHVSLRYSDDQKMPHFLRDVADERTTSDGGHHVCAMEFSLYMYIKYRLLKVYTSF